MVERRGCGKVQRGEDEGLQGEEQQGEDDEEPSETGELDEECVAEPTYAHGPGVSAESSVAWSEVVGVGAEVGDGGVPAGEAAEPVLGAEGVAEEPGADEASAGDGREVVDLSEEIEFLESLEDAEVECSAADASSGEGEADAMPSVAVGEEARTPSGGEGVRFGGRGSRRIGG